jgi:hypothetical protein
MMAWRVRIGPWSTSSSGRTSVKIGPVSISGGSREARRKNNEAIAIFIAATVVIAVVVIAVMWPVTLLGHALGLTPSWHQLLHRNRAWKHQHYPLLGLRYLGVVAIGIPALLMTIRAFARRKPRQELRGSASDQTRRTHEQPRAPAGGARKAHDSKLDQTTSVLRFPQRITQDWIRHNVPGLQPEQGLAVISELRRRGWNDAEIRSRVVPYLSNDVRRGAPS